MIRRSLAAVLLALPLAADPATAINPNKAEPGLEAQGWTAVDLKYVPAPKGVATTCYQGGPSPVEGTSLGLPAKNGVAIAPEQFALGIDVNGDGKIDERLKSNGATATFTLTYADGSTAPWMGRFIRDRAGKWQIERSGSWNGTVNKIAVQLLDQNNNGLYDENGADAIAIGTSGSAIPLSRVVHLGDALYSLKVADSGRKLWIKPFTGDTGTLDATSGYKAPAKLIAAVFRSGDVFVNAISGANPVVVPAGEYQFIGGEVGATSGGLKATMKRGKTEPFALAKGATAAPAWGMDVRIVFEYKFEKGVLTITGNQIRARGSAGEEYTNFTPIKLAPEVLVWKDNPAKPVFRAGCAICPQGSLLDVKGSIAGTAPFKLQLAEAKLAKLFGTITSEVVELK